MPHRVFDCSACGVTICGACACDCHRECGKRLLRFKGISDTFCSCVVSGKCTFATAYSQDP